MDRIHIKRHTETASDFHVKFKIRASEIGQNIHKVKIYVNEEQQIGFFIIDTYNKTIVRGLRHGSLLTLMGIKPDEEYNYDAHIKIIEQHNLFLKKRFRKFSINHCLGEKYYYLDENGEVKISNRKIEDEKIKNLLAFPTPALASRAKNYNRVQRYLLLWLYQNGSEIGTVFDANDVCYYLETKDDNTFEIKVKEWTEEEDIDDKDLIYETPETGPLMTDFERYGFKDLLDRGYGRTVNQAMETQTK